MRKSKAYRSSFLYTTGALKIQETLLQREGANGREPPTWGGNKMCGNTTSNKMRQARPQAVLRTGAWRIRHTSRKLQRPKREGTPKTGEEPRSTDDYAEKAPQTRLQGSLARYLCVVESCKNCKGPEKKHAPKKLFIPGCCLPYSNLRHASPLLLCYLDQVWQSILHNSVWRHGVRTPAGRSTCLLVVACCCLGGLDME